MPRAKKKKVVVEARGADVVTNNSGTTAIDEESGENVGEELEGPGEARPESPELTEKELRKEMTAAVKEMRKLVVEAQLELRKAEAEERLEVRRDEERRIRWDAAEKRSEPPPAYLQVERCYKSMLKGVQAAYRRSQAETRAAKAEVALQEVLLMQEKCAHDLTRAKLVGEAS